MGDIIGGLDQNNNDGHISVINSDHVLQYTLKKDNIRNEFTSSNNYLHEFKSSSVVRNERLEKLDLFRALAFNNTKVKVTRIDAEFFHEFAKKTHDKPNPLEHELFQHLKSFNIY